jgi:N-methylhydantoinase A/oxoprolinase/acetone carboxylase beta subunit
MQSDRVRTWPKGADLTGLGEQVASMKHETEALAPARLDPDVELEEVGRPLRDDQEPVASFDCRYEGQSHEIRVSVPEDFPSAHEQRNGYVRPGTPVEVVTIRVTQKERSPVQIDDLPPVERIPAVGPAVIAEDDCTIWVPPGWRADVHPVSSAFVITRDEP